MGHLYFVILDVERSNLAIFCNEGDEDGEDADEGPGCLADEGRLNMFLITFSNDAEEQAGECFVYVTNIIVFHLVRLPCESGDFSAAGRHGIGESWSIRSWAGHSYWRRRVMSVVCRVERYKEVSKREEIRLYAACTAA